MTLRQDFITVDRHLWAAFEQMHKHMDPPTDFCKSIMRRARQTQELAVKKLFWLTLLCMSQDMQVYYGTHCDSRKFTPFMQQLRPALDKFTKGAHRDGFSKCKSVKTARSSIRGGDGSFVRQFVDHCFNVITIKAGTHHQRVVSRIKCRTQSRSLMRHRRPYQSR
jgi:hypothetical protein